MTAGKIGLLDTPRQQNATAVARLHDAEVPWAADNGCYSDRWDEESWWRFLTRYDYASGSCLFAVAPDVVADARSTLERSLPWLSRIRDLGYPAALVAQDGLEDLEVPWDDFDVLFVGGSTEWKLGPEARGLVGQARDRGVPVHLGRVNSERRYAYARGIGCDSVDGTFLTYGPDQNLPRLLAWTRLADQGLLELVP